MIRAKLLLTLLFGTLGVAACFTSGPEQFSIRESREPAASLFRQNCAICHGPEGEGRMLDDGTLVPSLRRGEFKRITEQEIYEQIAEGGNGMLPFRNQLTEREMRLLSDLVRNKLRQ
ncbi:c-type cytochrome [Leptolyngbya sp. 7M]|uniref:c-type cytochrome n=1 Tax=Leptolyngbya sp. 7M TaxID=2812896 RepID=UPI001B8CF6F5|nr:cytochrome c [Leptolyngbya sp. 7M]QYO66249.1 cytochrome c [Leptolyngbya sp. 7M]